MVRLEGGLDSLCELDSAPSFVHTNLTVCSQSRFIARYFSR